MSQPQDEGLPMSGAGGMESTDRSLKGSGKTIITCMAVMSIVYGAVLLYTFWPLWQD